MIEDLWILELERSTRATKGEMERRTKRGEQSHREEDARGRVQTIAERQKIGSVETKDIDYDRGHGVRENRE